jgi:hypothetical protein
MSTKDRDGCGPNSWDTGSGDPFYDACRAHDLAYAKQLDETLADREFLRAMRQRVERERLWYRKPILAARATLYAGVVTGLGWLWWNYL